MARAALLILVLVAVSGCGGDAHAPPDLLAARFPEWGLYEPVVRYLLPRAQAAAGGARPIVYLSLPEDSPVEEFCRRFADAPVTVLPASARPAKPGPGDYFIRISEVGGDKVQWQGPDQARVFVLDHPANETLRCGTPYPIRVRRDGERWVVAER